MGFVVFSTYFLFGPWNRVTARLRETKKNHGSDKDYVFAGNTIVQFLQRL